MIFSLNRTISVAILLSLSCSLSFGGEIPTGQILEARLLTPAGTRISKVGDPLFAVLISPILQDGQIIVPTGTEIEGTVVDVAKLGFGIRNGRAKLGLRFHTVHLEKDTAVPLNARLVQVDTARERVDDLGQVYGISSPITVSGALATYAWRLVLLEPMVGSAVWATKFLFAPAPDPEIMFPRGTEILLRVTSTTPVPLPSTVHSVAALSAQDSTSWQSLINAFPSLRIQEKSGRDGDRINIALGGEPEAIRRAFQAAGWDEADHRNARSVAQTYFAVVQRRGYLTAPMSPMKFGDEMPHLAFQKSLNTFSKRHHLRLWLVGNSPSGVPLWLGSATEDTHIGFSRKSKRWTHFIDNEIDNERTKVLSDLLYTECVNEAGLINIRPVVIPDVTTDGQVAIAQVNACTAPRHMPVHSQKQRQISRFARGMSAFSKDLVRSNIVTLGLTAGRIPPYTLLGKDSPEKQRNAWAEQQQMRLLGNESRQCGDCKLFDSEKTLPE